MRGPFTPRTAILAGLALLGAGCGAAETDDLADNPAPRLKSTPQSVVFGRVPVQGLARQTIRLENVGNAPSAALTGGAQSSLDCRSVLDSQPFCLQLPTEPLAPGQSAEAWVIYHPQAQSVPQETSWSVSCADNCQTVVSARGSAVGEPVAATEMLDFGRSHPGCTRTQMVSLSSEVDIDLEIQSVQVEADAPGIYSVQTDSLPSTLAAGAQINLPLTFVSRAGDLPGSLNVQLIAPGQGLTEDAVVTVRVALIGRGDDSDPPCD